MAVRQRYKVRCSGRFLKPWSYQKGIRRKKTTAIASLMVRAQLAGTGGFAAGCGRCGAVCHSGAALDGAAVFVVESARARSANGSRNIESQKFRIQERDSSLLHFSPGNDATHYDGRGGRPAEAHGSFRLHRCGLKSFYGRPGKKVRPARPPMFHHWGCDIILPSAGATRRAICRHAQNR